MYKNKIIAFYLVYRPPYAQHSRYVTADTFRFSYRFTTQITNEKLHSLILIALTDVKDVDRVSFI